MSAQELRVNFAVPSYSWKRNFYVDNNTDRIVGEVSRLLSGGWGAFARGRSLGTFYSEEGAKRAVERAA